MPSSGLARPKEPSLLGVETSSITLLTVGQQSQEVQAQTEKRDWKSFNTNCCRVNVFASHNQDHSFPKGLYQRCHAIDYLIE